MSTIDKAEVVRIADLAALEVPDGDLARVTRELDTIIGYVRQLQAVDVEGVAPTAHVQLDRMPLRSDEEAPSLARETVLEQAPQANEDGFVVPAFVDEG